MLLRNRLEKRDERSPQVSIFRPRSIHPTKAAPQERQLPKQQALPRRDVLGDPNVVLVTHPLGAGTLRS